MNREYSIPAPQLPAPARLGQGTAIEQSRAVAEVHAAIVVAQQCPRSISAARAEMHQSCQQKGLTERAFYRYPRGNKTVTGPSVHLARELARCFGNVQYGIGELRRDDEHGESEMQAWAWDVQTNTRSSQIFIVPHKRDVTGGPVKLIDLRDIYENNANMGARRLREAIFSILPPWFIEEGKELCAKAIERGDGRPLEQRIADAVKVFEGMGVSADRLEQKLGRPKARWSGYDIAQLLITHTSLQRREVTVDEEFPQPRVTAAEITGNAAQSPAPARAAAPPPTEPPSRDPEEVWSAIVKAWPNGGGEEVERAFAEWSGGDQAGAADLEQLTAFLAEVTAGRIGAARPAGNGAS